MQSRQDIQRLAEIYGGVPVLGALPGTPASRAGTRYGDIILEVNGTRVRSLDDYFDTDAFDSTTLDLLVMRAGKEVRIHLELDPFDGAEVELPSSETRVEKPAPAPAAPRKGDIN